VTVPTAAGPTPAVPAATVPTTAVPTAAVRAAGDLDASRPVKLTWPRVLRSELIKLRSLRPTWWALAVMVVATAGLGVIYAVAVRAEEYGDGSPAHPVGTTLRLAQYIVQFVALVLGTLGAASEYGSGAIRSSLCSVPRRWQLLVCQTAAVAAWLAGGVAVTLALAGSVISGLLTVRGIPVQVGWDDLPPLLGMVFYGLVIGLTAFFLTVATRSAVGGVSLALGVTFMAPIMLMLASAIGLDWCLEVAAFLPEHVAGQTWSTAYDPIYGGVAGGYAMGCGWIVIGLIVVGGLFQRRDA
jgi:ABC-2 type transport system permease protein